MARCNAIFRLDPSVRKNSVTPPTDIRRAVRPVEALARANISSFKFIDLFAGIGGTRLGFEAVGGRCVFGSEWDRFARETYLTNHGDADTLAGDVNKIDLTDVPHYEVQVPNVSETI